MLLNIQNKRFYRLIVAWSICLSLILEISIPSNIYAVDTAEENMAAPIYELNILEIQPNHSFELSNDTFSIFEANDNVTLTQMSMPEFISRIEDINGKYDVVYIGNKVVDGVGYSAKGERYPDNVSLPQGGTNGIEYYSGIDITNRRAEKLKEFIESGQLTVFSSNIFSDNDLGDTKLYENFSTYIDRDNVVLVEDPLDYFIYSRSHPNGLKGEYYNYSGFPFSFSFPQDQLYDHVRIDSNIDFNWARNSPMDGINAERFAVRWTGNILPRYSETYTFYTNSDDGVRLWVNGKLIINEWREYDTTEHSGTIELETGKLYDIKLEYFDYRRDADIQLKWQSLSQGKEVVPHERLFLPSYYGIKGEYYNYSSNINGINFPPGQTRDTTRVDETINNQWSYGTIHEDLNSDRVAIRWTGKVIPNYSETYTFHTQVDDGVRLWVNGDLLIDEWDLQWNGQYTGTIFLRAGRLYDIKMEYFEYYGEAQAKLRWSSQGQQQEIIPRISLLVPEDIANEYAPNTFFADYNLAKKRPFISIGDDTRPKEYNGSEDSYSDDDILSFGFEARNRNSDVTMTAKLYIDIDGDGIFKGDEVVEEISGMTSGPGYTINYRVSDSYTGLLPWKLELIDNETGAKSYRNGYVAFKGDPLNIRVLQLTPSGNNFQLNRLNNVSGMNLLEKDGEYSIEITKIPIDEFDSRYPNPYNGKSTILNGNYDMVIIGFADVIGNDDIDRSETINTLKDFINTDQSVMFTHDTMTFRMNNENGWAYNLTKEFRDLIGQNIYVHEELPDPNKASYGFSDLALDRARHGQFFTTRSAHKLNDGLLTKYPFVLEDINVARTHFQYFKLDMEDEEIIPWYTFTGDSRHNKYDGRNDYYTYTKGSITFSGTGHSSPNSLDEQKLFINTIIKASRGANHAPSLNVYDISNGQNITPSQDEITFSIMADDIDEHDDNLTAKVYLDEELVKTFDFQKGNQIPVAIENTIPDGVENFSIKVVVNDSFDAEAVQVINLTHLSIPTVNLTINSEDGYLIGDSITMDYTINCESGDNCEYIQNISIETDVASESLEITNRDGWQLVNGKLVSSPTLADNVRTITATALQEAELEILTQLQYSALGESIEVDFNKLIDIKSGSIDIEVVDNLNRGYENVGVHITKPDGTIIDTQTNETGICTVSELPSGSYEITIDIPNGYSNDIDNNKIINLSYDYNEQEVRFVLEGNPLTDVTRELPETLKMSENYTIQYTPVGDTVVYDNSRGFETIEFQSISYDETFPIGIELISYPNGLIKTGSIETGYRLQGEIDAIYMNRLSSGASEYEVSGSFSIEIAYKEPGVYNFSQGSLRYHDPYTIEGEIIVDGGNVEIVDDIPPDDPIITADPTTPTNGEVTITITVETEDDDDIGIKYKLGEDGEWLDYTEKIIITENTVVYSKTVDTSENESSVVELTIDNINNAITDIEFTSGEDRHDSVFRIGRLKTRFIFNLGEEVDGLEFKFQFDGEDISGIKLANSNGTIGLVGSETSDSLTIDNNENTCIVNRFLSPGQYVIEIPIDVNYLEFENTISVVMKIAKFRINSAGGFTNILSKDNLNELNIEIIELPKLL